MFIAVVGTRYSGSSTVEEYLVGKGFTHVCLEEFPESNQADGGHTVGLGARSESPVMSDASSTTHIALADTPRGSKLEMARSLSFLSMSSSSGDTLASPSGQPPQSLRFYSADSLLDHVTRNWRSNFVTTDLRTRAIIEPFVKRPFFMLICIDAPLHHRFKRSRSHNLDEFIRQHDELMFGLQQKPYGSNEIFDSFHSLSQLANVNIVNSFDSVSALYTHLDAMDLLNHDRLRPGWDSYFMTLASLASRRSNCMKRRVGAILVRDHRILATGYNGTPRGLLNCNEGGCVHCNGAMSSDKFSLECVCLHAEENALLETGRDRIGSGAVLYCNTCPCLKCTVKIIQNGVKEVVYNLSYKVDDASASLFKQAGVELRRYAPPP
ncbi:hypothetical protein PLICRDRAFT_36306 [Plicaturopsis crispa FD-325 SS-3]|nr:hypothetical protein PLICRDRAFT_36306 [Plicaturopsis crispa FD-325 SS-3]